jgi:hypothetical protein
MERVVTKFIQCCRICHSAKSRSQDSGLYTLLPVVKAHWEDVNKMWIRIDQLFRVGMQRKPNIRGE